VQKREIPVSQFDSRNLKSRISSKYFPFPRATLILLGVVFLCSAIVAAWFAGNDTINSLFTQIHFWQANPPIWLKVPMVEDKYLLLPTVGCLFTVFVVMKVSPQPQNWSRQLVVGILIILTLRYVLWRSLSTLNVADPLNGVFSLGLLVAEMLVVLNSTIQLFFLLNIKERHREADAKSLAVIDGSFTPSVDILIPTYNEPVFILRRTIIGCQVLDYARKKIYLLDDTRRTEMKYLAKELGCEYITRPDNLHAKAGNLNHAIAQTHGELIVVFDADFIPTKNFLTRTVGFFQDAKVALVQTPQTFYNSDPVARNLGLENILTHESEVFHRQVQASRDASGSAICSGTSFVVRRSSLEKTGGFVVESLSEDYLTGIRLCSQGYRLLYLNEKLSAGLAAENITSYAIQRLRWEQGTLQALFLKFNPLTIPGMSLIQRLAYLGGLLYWFSNISRIYFLLMPLAYSFLHVIPLQSTPAELLYFLLPYYLVNLAVFSWLNYRSSSALISDIYSILICFPLSLNIIQVMLNPFAKGFKVTPKGIFKNRYSYNWRLALPLISLFIATAISLWVITIAPTTQPITGINLAWLWSSYNLIMIGITLWVLLDVPKADMYEWFDLRRVVHLRVGKQSLWGVTTMISEVGAEVALTQNQDIYLLEHQPINIEIIEENLHLKGEIIGNGFNNEFPTVRVKFTSVSLSQYRRLVEMLFCRPGQWKHQNAPGEFTSLILLLRILLKPRSLFDKKVDIKPVIVAKI
jgi:cellulose synthase (UDP-forming)